MEQPDPLHHLLHRGAVALERALEADLHEVQADLASVELERDEMRLLGDPHGRARMAAAQLDDPRERGVRDGRSRPRRSGRARPRAPLFGLDRAERVEAAEAAERPPARGEQVRASRARCCPRTGSDTDVLRWKTARMRLVTGLGVAVRLAAPRPAPGTRRRTGSAASRPPPPPARGARARGRAPARGPARRARASSATSTPSPSSPTIFTHAPRACAADSAARPGASRPAQRAVRRGAIGDHGGRERLGQLARIREAEQVELRRVGAPPREPAERRLADARLAGRRGPRHHEMRAGLEPGRRSRATSSRRPISCPAGTGESVGNRRPLGRRR